MSDLPTNSTVIKLLHEEIKKQAKEKFVLQARITKLEKVVEAAKPLLDEELTDSMTLKQNYTFVHEHMIIYKAALYELITL